MFNLQQKKNKKRVFRSIEAYISSTRIWLAFESYVFGGMVTEYITSTLIKYIDIFMVSQ